MKKYPLKLAIFNLLYFITSITTAQESKITGTVNGNGTPIAFANILIAGTTIGTSTDENGNFSIDKITSGSYILQVSAIGYIQVAKAITFTQNESQTIVINLNTASEQLKKWS